MRTSWRCLWNLPCKQCSAGGCIVVQSLCSLIPKGADIKERACLKSVSVKHLGAVTGDDRSMMRHQSGLHSTIKFGWLYRQPFDEHLYWKQNTTYKVAASYRLEGSSWDHNVMNSSIVFGNQLGRRLLNAHVWILSRASGGVSDFREFLCSKSSLSSSSFSLS